MESKPPIEESAEQKRTPINWPAKILVVAGFLAIAGFMTIIFLSEPSVAPVSKSALSQSVDYLATQPAARVLGTLVESGNPPPDILRNLAFPADATVTGRFNIDHDAGTYDRTVSLSTPLLPSQVAGFYRTYLKSHRWILSYVGGAANSPDLEVLAEKPSNDTYFWEVGVDIAPRPTGGKATAFSLNLSIVQSG